MVGMADDEFRRLIPVSLFFPVLLRSKVRTSTMQILHFSNFIWLLLKWKHLSSRSQQEKHPEGF